MTRRNLRVYEYREVPEELPPSKRKTTIVDSLDSSIENFWNEEIRQLMQPIGHPQSKRYFIQQYQAATKIKAMASKQGVYAVSSASEWALMSALRRVAHRRGITPKDLLKLTAIAAE
jgi:hypothetical protein